MCKDEKKKKSFSRRSFVKAGLFSSAGVMGMSPLQLAAVSMMQNILNPVLAQESGVSRNYILLMIDQGIMKSLFDLPLRPNGNDSYSHNMQHSTRFGSLADINNYGTYAHTKVGDYYLPHLWSGTAPSASGGQRAISGLAQNAMMIRGINTGSASHVASKQAQNRPSQIRGSLTGLNADKSTRPFPSIHGGSSWNYFSEDGNASIGFSNLNLLLKPLTGISNPMSFGSNEQMKAMANNMISLIRDMKRNQSLKSRSYFDDSENAKKMFLTSFGDLNTIYKDLETKYTNLIKRSFFEHTLTGFDKEPVIVHKHKGFAYNQEDMYKVDKDLRDMIVFNGKSYGQEQLVLANHKDTLVTGLASGFAVAEYMLSNKLTSTVTINGSQAIQGLYNRWQRIEGTGHGASYNHVFGLDGHFSGGVITSFFHGKYQKAVAACMLELFDNLRSAGVYDNTVLNLCTDFHRCGVKGAIGSDHGHEGSSLSLFGGLIDGLQVGGNILAEATSGGGGRQYPGTWGQGAGVDLVGGRALNVGNAASTVATILGVKTPKVNDASVVKMTNGKAKLLLGKPKNV